ncbi:hypothetical protein [Streptomyces sp. NPDC056069]|uniref:hypothetical protein n=1 Tax=Streptomyces sp. NPDC056069 TaxID=3345702 RepID=UPI0035D90857
MPETARRSAPAGRTPSARWWRWSVLCALPSAAVALGSSWVYEPHTAADALMAATLSSVAVYVFATTMPLRRRSTTHQARRATLAIVEADPDPDGGSPSDTYELRVYGVSVLVRLRQDWKGERLVPYVHIDHEADRPRLLLVEVDNKGETEHR